MNNSIKILTIFCLTFLISCGSPERTEDNQTAARADDAEVEVGVENLEVEEDYLVSAHLNSQLQLALGSVAAERSTTPQVQQFGQRVANSNQIVKNNLTELATGYGINLSPAMSTKYTNLLDSIQNYTGKDFDSAFLNIVIEEHEEDIDRFTTLSQRTSNPIVRNLLTDNLEILHMQKNEAEELKDSLDLD
jgi:putative membrane protein